MDFDDLKNLLGEELSKELEDFVSTAGDDGKKYLKIATEGLQNALKILARADYLSLEERKKRAKAQLDLQASHILAIATIKELEVASRAYAVVEKVLDIVITLIIQKLATLGMG